MAKPRAQRRVLDVSAIPEIDWARLAAYIDGEGHIAINENKQKARSYVYLRVVVTNTDPRLVRWLIERFGGGVSRQTQHKKASYRTTFKWCVSCRQAEVILRQCLPYFVTKRDQADIALTFQETLRGFRKGNPLPSSVVVLREEHRAQLIAARWASHPADDLLQSKTN